MEQKFERMNTIYGCGCIWLAIMVPLGIPHLFGGEQTSYGTALFIMVVYVMMSLQAVIHVKDCVILNDKGIQYRNGLKNAAILWEDIQEFYFHRENLRIKTEKKVHSCYASYSQQDKIADIISHKLDSKVHNKEQKE